MSTRSLLTLEPTRSATPWALYHGFALTENAGLVKSREWVYNTPLLQAQPAGAQKGSRSLEPESADSKRNSPPRPRLTIIVVALAVSIIVLFIKVPPSTVLGKADVVGYAICHRIPERSFILGGHQLPLCARCTGTFLGVLLGLGTMIVLGRRRASYLPPVAVMGILLVFTGFWAFDGTNSYLTLFPGLPHLYEPRNWLRLTTGMLNGLTLITFAFPIFNFTIWREPAHQRVIQNVWEVAAILPVAAVLIYVVQAQIDWLLYPLAILSSLGVVVMLVLVNSMIAAVALGREGYARTWLQALVPITAGTGLAILEMTAMVLLRAYLTTRFGLPF
jgi:uncharacterized membrane protein